jgi:hypothetical protein
MGLLGLCISVRHVNSLSQLKKATDATSSRDVITRLGMLVGYIDHNRKSLPNEVGSCGIGTSGDIRLNFLH